MGLLLFKPLLSPRRMTTYFSKDKPKRQMLLNFVADRLDELVIEVDVDLVVASRK